MRRAFAPLACWLLLCGTAAAGAPPPDTTRAADAVRVTGHLYGDLLLADASGEATLRWEEAPVRRRSVPLAFALSAAVPGAGQAYNRSWVRAVVYAGLEVALWTGYAVWRSEGLDLEDAYRAEAHRHWSPADYGAWLLGYDGFTGDGAALDRALGAARGVDFRDPGAWTPGERAAVRDLISAIRAAEDASTYLSTGAAFSHLLPYFGEQQYYELIGKYVQFNPGWSDWQGADLPASAAEATPQFLDYADQRAESNDLLRRASRATAVVVVNHALSAFDAMLTARVHNLRLDSEVALVPDARGDVAPVARLRVRF